MSISSYLPKSTPPSGQASNGIRRHNSQPSVIVQVEKASEEPASEARGPKEEISADRKESGNLPRGFIILETGKGEPSAALLTTEPDASFSTVSEATPPVEAQQTTGFYDGLKKHLPGAAIGTAVGASLVGVGLTAKALGDMHKAQDIAAHMPNNSIEGIIKAVTFPVLALTGLTIGGLVLGRESDAIKKLKIEKGLI